jgi:hypothetical protein
MSYGVFKRYDSAKSETRGGKVELCELKNAKENYPYHFILPLSDSNTAAKLT